MLVIRGNILATSISFNASDASRKPDDLDDLDAAGSSYAGRKRLRALSGVFRVVVRVHSGALAHSGAWKALLSTSFPATGLRFAHAVLA